MARLDSRILRDYRAPHGHVENSVTVAPASGDNEETVTVIELLSPTNKSSRDGRAEYLAKRNLLLRGRAHLVELDLLRGGERPMALTLGCS